MKERITHDIIITGRGEGVDVDITFPHDNISKELQMYALEEIAQQIYDVMDISQKSEWDDEEYAITFPQDKSEIVVKICYPDNFDLTNIMQIKVLTGYFDSLDEVKVANFHIDNIVEALQKAHASDDCCCE